MAVEIDSIGRNPASDWCLSVEHRCEKLVVPPANKMALDKCIRFGVLIDRNHRQRPVRCGACKEETK